MIEEENLKRMRTCPRFDNCSIPKCPLDYWADLRTELSEDERCPYWRIVGQKRSLRMKGRLSPVKEAMSRIIRENYENASKKGIPE